jgi:type 1 glutamine amidotransferase
MRLVPRHVVFILELALGFALCAILAGSSDGTAASAPADAREAAPWRVLVFTKTAGFHHESIPAAVQAVETLGKAHGFAVDATDDAAAFNSQNLRQYRVVVFLLTTGDVLDRAQQVAFENFIHGGGGYVGVHSASDTEYGWPWYGQLMGAYFQGHPAIQPATIEVVVHDHPSTHGLPRHWIRTDEWYNFQAQPQNVQVLARVDESTYVGGTMGASHPIIWCHEFSGGRAWYTALGHTIESYSEPLFLKHLLGGITWAAASEASTGTTPP